MLISFFCKDTTHLILTLRHYYFLFKLGILLNVNVAILSLETVNCHWLYRIFTK